MWIKIDLIEDFHKLERARLAQEQFHMFPYSQDIRSLSLEALMDRDLGIDLGGIEQPYLRRRETLLRQVPPKRYSVFESRELKANELYKQLKGVIHEISAKLRSGKSIAMYLPDYQSPRRPQEGRDHMLNHWDIRHLHLSPESTIRPNGLVARSDFLLFFTVEDDHVYLLDIVPHKSQPAQTWYEQRFLKILDDNWPTKASFMEPCGPEPTIESFKAARMYNYNVPPTVNGKFALRGANGVTATGHPMKVTFDLIAIVKHLQQVQREFANGGEKHAQLRAIFRERKLYPCAHVRMIQFEERARMVLKEMVSGQPLVMLFEHQPLPSNS